MELERILEKKKTEDESANLGEKDTERDRERKKSDRQRVKERVRAHREGSGEHQLSS